VCAVRLHKRHRVRCKVTAKVRLALQPRIHVSWHRADSAPYHCPPMGPGGCPKIPAQGSGTPGQSAASLCRSTVRGLPFH
jgi:hypothetical protein